MSPGARGKRDKRADDEDDNDNDHHHDNDDRRGTPRKRRMTSRSPEAAAATHVSIFGAGTAARAAGESLEVGGGGGSGAPTPRSPAGMTGAAARAERAATADGEERQIERLFSERVVTIVVGPSEVTWRIHENLLSGASDFFKSAFNSGFKEALEDRLALPEDDPQAFELFVRWLYARAMAPLGPSSSASASASASVSVSASTSTSSSPAGANNSTSSALLLSLLGGSGSAGGVGIQIRTCLRLYVLAHKLLVEELENACADAAGLYYRAGTRRPDVRDAQYVYERTPRGAGGLRRLLAERLALGLFRGKSQQSQPQHADAAAAAEWRDVLNETPDLGFDIISEIAGYRWVSGGNAPARTVSAPCAFHRHESGEQCR